MIVTHPQCGKSWIQVGNQTGHCAQCHETFGSIQAFDLHQTLVDGRVVCADLTTLGLKPILRRFHLAEDGVWRLEMTETQRQGLERLKQGRKNLASEEAK